MWLCNHGLGRGTRDPRCDTRRARRHLVGFRGASETFAIVWGRSAWSWDARPENLNGWLFAMIGLLFAAEAVLNEYVVAGALVVPGGLPGTVALSWPLTWLWSRRWEPP